MHQKQKKIPERVGAEDTGRTGRRLSGDRVNNPVTASERMESYLKQKAHSDFKGLTEICQSLFYAVTNT